MICSQCKKGIHHKCASLKCRCSYECNKGFIVENRREQKLVCQKGKIEKTVTKEDLSRAIASLREAGIGSKFLVTTYGR